MRKMEEVVWEAQSGNRPAEQMVAQWIANGDNGQVGDPAQKHVVGEPKYHQG